jgi:hypothetical protein
MPSSPWPIDSLPGGCGHDHEVPEWLDEQGLIEPLAQAAVALGYSSETHHLLALRYPTARGCHVGVLATRPAKLPLGLSSFRADG